MASTWGTLKLCKTLEKLHQTLIEEQILKIRKRNRRQERFHEEIVKIPVTHKSDAMSVWDGNEFYGLFYIMIEYHQMNNILSIEYIKEMNTLLHDNGL